jgi:hypothetical protein
MIIWKIYEYKQVTVDCEYDKQVFDDHSNIDASCLAADIESSLDDDYVRQEQKVKSNLFLVDIKICLDSGINHQEPTEEATMRFTHGNFYDVYDLFLLKNYQK